MAFRFLRTKERDWLQEAFDIYDRTSKAKPHKKHIDALVVRLTETMQKTQRIAMHLEQAILNAENKKRVVNKEELLQRLRDLPKTINGKPINQ